MDGSFATTGLMRAAVLAAAGRFRLEEVERPQPGPGQVRVRLEGCGVCASNLGPWGGASWMQFPTEPGALGHEGWGVVDALGEGVRSFAPGDRVATLSGNSYAEYDLAEASEVVRLPDILADQPFPGEPLGGAMNVFQRAEIQPCQTVAIVGIGFLGAVLTRLASFEGARVIAISRRPYALEVARRMGAAETIVMDDQAAVLDEVRALTGGRLCERVIEAVGKQEALDLASELVCERGRLVIAGHHQDGPRHVNMPLWNWRGIDVINAHERDPRTFAAGVREAAQAVASGRLDPGPLYTHSYPLERLDEALNAVRDRPDGFLKALVVP
jgi:threonine dehydrogenase-like Zn-dependent dehydrogenase